MHFSRSNSPQSCPLFQGIRAPLKPCFPEPIRLHSLDSMLIGSAVSARLTVVSSRHTRRHIASCYTLCMRLKKYAVVSRTNLRGPSDQGVMWLRTYLFNHYTISLLAIFHSSSSSQIPDFSLICLPFASDDCLCMRLLRNEYLLFSTLIFWFNFQRVLCRLYENTAISFISAANVKIFNLVIHQFTK